MKNYRVVLTLFAVSVFATYTAQAQATRTWVSGGAGNDSNPCSRTAPCQTFAGAIFKTAPGGEVDVIDPGGFGGVTITKAITIDGGGGQMASALVSGTNGIVVAAGTSDVVTLRNVWVQGIGAGLNGIEFSSGAALNIEHCVIENFTEHGIQITPSSGKAYIVDTVSRNNHANGLSIAGHVRVSVSNSHFDNNGANGVFAGDNSSVAVDNSDANGNGQDGFVARGSSASVTMGIANSMAANNAGGVAAGGAGAVSSVHISNVSVFGNTNGLVIGSNGTIASFGNNSNADTGTPNAHIALQ
jgi:hypothetical protein